MKKLIALLFIVCFAAVGFAQEQDGGVFPPAPGPNGEGMFGFSAASNNGHGGGQHDGGKFPPSPGPNGKHNKAVLPDGAEEDGGVFPPAPGPVGDPVLGDFAASKGGGGKHDGGKFPPTPGPNDKHNRSAFADGGEQDGGVFPPTPGPTGEGMFG